MHSFYKIDILYSSDNDKRELEPLFDKIIEKYALDLKTLNAGELTITKQ